MGSVPALSICRAWPSFWRRVSKLSLSDCMNGVLHRTIFPRYLDQIRRGLNEPMAVIGQALHLREHLRRLQTEQLPIRMLHQAHIAGTGKMEVIGDIERDFGTDGKSLDTPMRSRGRIQEAEVRTAAEKIARD